MRSVITQTLFFLAVMAAALSTLCFFIGRYGGFAFAAAACFATSFAYLLSFNVTPHEDTSVHTQVARFPGRRAATQIGVAAVLAAVSGAAVLFVIVAIAAFPED